ncbi:Fe-S cluster assembly protein HesB [Auraticoccus sp. F435]|uniref:Fe-S cluster assembly protein HesB n=1 Tax=Auraticoccus cholistanensis TaxID=2656650 RepID=A0A6A9UT19_9ACTN|nr:HhH-GPD-type base excision DNA repair protein [Auraticoccus cholistanensis]MVA75831.1 Fe-S cluster assembly protein HesB [Auraticoccus cholistanensis]
MDAERELWLTGDPEADALLSRDLNALLIGMTLDQQIPMEKAFSGPAVIARRMGGRLDVAAIAQLPVEDFVALCSERPAVHRFPGSMGARVHQVCQALVRDWEGDARTLVETAPDGAELRRRIEALPGFGRQKASIFVALLGKQLGVAADGWQQAAGEYGQDGYRSVADVVDEASLQKVREHKKMVKAQAKAARATTDVPAG